MIEPSSKHVQRAAVHKRFHHMLMVMSDESESCFQENSHQARLQAIKLQDSRHESQSPVIWASNDWS